MNLTRVKTAMAVLLALSLVQLASAEVDTIAVFTENTPITQASKNNPNGGEATRFVTALLMRAGLAHELHFEPWRRAYQRAKNYRNTLIYPLARSSNREDNFHWIGEILPIQYYLFRLKSRTDIKTATLQQAGQYKIGVVNYHAVHEYLLGKGIDNVQPVNSIEQNIRKLLLGRIDLLSISDSGILPLCQRTNIDCSQLSPALRLDDDISGLYLAFGKDTEQSIIDRARQAYREMVEDGSHHAIFSQRLDRLAEFHSSWKTTGQ